MNDEEIILRNRQFINSPAIAHLAKFPNWVGYWLAPRPNGKDKKIPVNPLTGLAAKSNDPNTWSTYQKALQAVGQFRLNGVGFMLTLEVGIIGGDLDSCLDNGALSAFAQQTIKTLKDTYWEISPGGKGLRFFAFGTLPPGRRRNDSIELYDSGRFLTVTGNHLSGTAIQITDQAEAIADLHQHIFGGYDPLNQPEEGDTIGNPLTDPELLAKALDSKGSEKFLRLWNGDTTGYPTPSEADQALVNLLCFWTNHDAERIDTLFRQSVLYRDKWDRQDYAERTISKALETVERGYRGISQNHNRADGMVKQCLVWTNSRQWTGRTGLTDKAIYLAHLEIVKRTGKIIYHASCRELAELTACHWTTANKANKRLVAMNLIHLSRKATPSLPHQFELVAIPQDQNQKLFHKANIPCGNGMYLYETPNENNDNSLIVCSLLKQNSDLWRQRGLGKTGLDIYSTMLDVGRSMTRTEIAKATGRSKVTVSRKLKTLIEVGMVAVDFGKYEALYVENETGIAKLLGTLGASEKQRQQHERERKAHKMKIESDKWTAKN